MAEINKINIKGVDYDIGGSTPIVEKVVLLSENQTQGTLKTPITQEEFALLASSENSILKVALQYADGNITEGFLLKCIMSTVIEQRIPSLAFGVTLVEPASSDGPYIQSIMASVLNYNNTEIITTFLIERAPLGGNSGITYLNIKDLTEVPEEYRDVEKLKNCFLTTGGMIYTPNNVMGSGSDSWEVFYSSFYEGTYWWVCINHTGAISNGMARLATENEANNKIVATVNADGTVDLIINDF